MVNTRSQNVDSQTACSSRMEQNSDNESECSFPEVLSRNQINEFENGEILNGRDSIVPGIVDQRFMEMNRQISDLTNIVLALTERLAPALNERNGLNIIGDSNVPRSDTVLSLR